MVSGGLDSAVLLQQLLVRGKRVVPLYVRCGFRWEKAELYWLRRLLKTFRNPALVPLRVLDLPAKSLYGAHWSLGGKRVPGHKSADSAVYLPGRNVLLIGMAAVVAAREGIRLIAIGTLAGNPFGDASPAFFARYARVLQMALAQPFTLLTPLRSRSKPRWLRRHKRDLRLDLTFSCLNPKGLRPCGVCNKCAERRNSFREAGIADPTTYLRKPNDERMR